MYIKSESKRRSISLNTGLWRCRLELVKVVLVAWGGESRRNLEATQMTATLSTKYDNLCLKIEI